jgi:hypothetical protein
VSDLIAFLPTSGRIARAANVGAARILGVEAEHRVLARDILGKTLPNDLCLEPQAFACVSNVAPALQPFLDGSNGQTAEIQMPSDMEIADAVGRFRCH